jgi:predicted anti-sigma-YlaC factor YlaD
MRCELVRTALSARLDGEDPPLATGVVDDHLAGCPDCRHWLLAAERLTRAVRVQAIEVPDLTARILAAAREQAALPAPRRTPRVGARPLRWGLGLLATLQLILAVPDLLGVAGHEAHAGREVAAFDVALAVGLLIAAFYPEQARVFAPVVATLVGCFAMISVVDVVQGLVTPGRIAVHAIAVAQAGLLLLLARATPPAVTPRERPAGQWE